MFLHPFFSRVTSSMRRSSVCVKLLLDVHCSEEIGNVQLDALGSQKYYHFIRLMGRAASNIALECALQTRPNVCLISEEVEAKGLSLKQVCMTLMGPYFYVSTSFVIHLFNVRNNSILFEDNTLWSVGCIRCVEQLASSRATHYGLASPPPPPPSCPNTRTGERRDGG